MDTSPLTPLIPLFSQRVPASTTQMEYSRVILGISLFLKLVLLESSAAGPRVTANASVSLCPLLTPFQSSLSLPSPQVPGLNSKDSCTHLMLFWTPQSFPESLSWIFLNRVCRQERCLLRAQAVLTEDQVSIILYPLSAPSPHPSL